MYLIELEINTTTRARLIDVPSSLWWGMSSGQGQSWPAALLSTVLLTCYLWDQVRSTEF